MDLHGEIMNITVEKRKQNLAIDEAMKSFKNMKDILVAVYARGHRDARHSAAEKAAQQTYALDGARVAAHCEHGYNGSCPECSAVQTPPRQ